MLIDVGGVRTRPSSGVSRPAGRVTTPCPSIR
jgi:hypothetical protein